MKILLVAPSSSAIYGCFHAPDHPPLGLAYLAAVLEREGHRIRIVDVDADRFSEADFTKLLKDEGYGLVGITTTTPTFNNAVYLTHLVKKHSSAKTVLGGIHVTNMPLESISIDSVDFVIKGEGEVTIVELARALEEQQEPDKIDGLFYKKDSRVIQNKERQLIEDLNSLPFPARYLFKHTSYNYPDALFKPAMPIMTSRGCPASCSFCCSRTIFTREFRARRPENIVDEIEYLIKEFKAKEIHIWDDNFVTQKNRVFDIRDEIKRRNIKIKFAFPNGIRSDYVDLELLRALKDMGTYSVAYGVESGNQAVLDRVNKNLKLEQIERVFKQTKRLGIETWAFFMIGLPGETARTIKDTIDFAVKLNPDVAKFHILKPFPGSEIYAEFTKQGLLWDKEFNHFGVHTAPVHRLEALSSEEILNWQKQAYREFYLRPSILLKQVLRLKSINRLKLNLIVGKDILKNIIR